MQNYSISGPDGNWFTLEARNGGTVILGVWYTPGYPFARGGRKQVTQRSTHERPGMHMQHCSAVLWTSIC